MRSWTTARNLVLTLALAALAGCHRAPPPGADALVIEATPVPHAEILREAARQLARDGVTLRIVPVTDYERPNADVAAGRAALNFFQTAPFLRSWNERHHTNLAPLAPVHVEPLGGYSRRYRSLARLPGRVTIAIPDDPANRARALHLLAQAGIVGLREPLPQTPDLRDVVQSRRSISWRQAPAGSLPSLLDEVDLALVNTNFALAAGLNPVTDALVIEGRNSPYANYLVGRANERDDARIAKLVARLRSPAMRRFIQRRYKGAVIPAF